MTDTMDLYTGEATVQRTMADLRREFGASGQRLNISDLRDADGNQYVDLVMEGGGVLGVGLVGFTWALEQMGVRFVSVGGTSAGSINALLLGAVARPSRPRAEAVLRILDALGKLKDGTPDKKNPGMMLFVDGGDDARDLVIDLIRPPGMGKNIRLARALWRNAGELLDDCGMNPGDAFRDWLIQQLATHGISTTGQLRDRMNDWPEGLTVEGKPIKKEDDLPDAKLKIVAADITLQRKAVFPDEAYLYYRNPERTNPAHYVRASMSVPYFFHPMRLDKHPNGATARENWRKLDYFGRIPEEIVFVDGGIISNFPISLFHAHDKVPRWPTFGAKLGLPVDQFRDASDPVKLAMAMFGLSRQAADRDFLNENPDYRHLVAHIDTGAVNWLNFKLGDDEKMSLFSNGVLAAAKLLRRFNWDRYKQIRAATAEAAGASGDARATAPRPRKKASRKKTTSKKTSKKKTTTKKSGKKKTTTKKSGRTKKT
jgi:NTE family protein